MDPFSADTSLWREHFKPINEKFIESISYFVSLQWFDLYENFVSHHNGFIMSTNQKKTFVYGEKVCKWISLKHQSNQPQEIKILNQKIIKQIAYNDDCFAILNEDGSVYFGGENSFWNTGQQLKPLDTGDNNHNNSFKQICCGYSHLLLLTTDYKLMAMGRNEYGQMTGTKSSRNKLISIDLEIGYVEVIQISCGHGHSLALTNHHEVYGWGWNEDGQLGFDNVRNLEKATLIKFPVPDDIKIREIIAGPKHSLFLMENGILYGCGLRAYGLNGTESKPIEIILKNVIAITSGWSFPLSLAIVSVGLEENCWLWGRSVQKEESYPRPILVEQPVDSFSEATKLYFQMPITFGWTKIIKSTAEKLSSSNRISFWAEHLHPIPDDFLQSIVYLISLQYFDPKGQFIHNGYIMATMQNHTWIYGEKICDWISLKHQDGQPQLIQILEKQNVIQVDYGFNFFTLLTEDGLVYLGSDHSIWETDRKLKQISNGEQRFKRICCGYAHLLLLDNDGKLMALGWNQFGQITGDFDSFDKIIETGLTNVIKISCGWQHSLALTKDRTVYSWGCNKNGRLGLGGQKGFEYRRRPFRIRSFDSKKVSVKDIEAGVSYSWFVMEDGTLYACGCNNDGELGIKNCDEYAATPVRSDIGIVQAVQSGWSFRFTIASTVDNAYYLWGKLGQKRMAKTRTCDQVESFPEAFQDQYPIVPPMTFGWLCLAKTRQDFMKIARMQLLLWKEHLKDLQNKFLKSITHFIRLHYFDEDFQHYDYGYLMCNNQNQLFVYGEEICQWLTLEHQPNQPQQIPEVDNKIVQQVDYGWNYLALLMTDGTVYLCSKIDSDWLTDGQLKLLNNDNQQFSQISCGHSHLLLLTSDNKLMAIGSNENGKITGKVDSFETMVDTGLTDVIKMDAGWDHSLAMTTDGKVYSWGCNNSGRLGVGDHNDRDEPTLIQFFCDIDCGAIKDLMACDMNSFFLMENGQLYGCGSNEFGELASKYCGHYDDKPRKIPVDYVTAMASGWSCNFIMVFTVENHFHVWGRVCDQIIRKNRINTWPMESFSEASSSYFKIPLTFGWTRIGKSSSFKDFNHKLKKASSVKLSLWQKNLQSISDIGFLRSITYYIALNWLNPGFQEQHNGYIMATNQKKIYFYGQVCQWISLEHEDSRPQPIQNPDEQNLIQIDYGSDFFTILMEDGSAFLGADPFSEWKTNGKLERLSKFDQRFKRICCGYQHLLLLTNDNKLMAMGWNKFGQITGNSDSYKTMIDTGLENVTKMSCGWQHSLALTNDGKVFSWGSKHCGQLGLNDVIEDQNKPNMIRFFSESVSLTIKDVLAACRISLFLTENCQLYGCGGNENGQLGLIDNLQRFIKTPIKLPLENVMAIVSGWSLDFSMAFTMNNSFYIWGLLNDRILRKPYKTKETVDTFSEASNLYIEMPLTFGWSRTFDQNNRVCKQMMNCRTSGTEERPRRSQTK